MKSSVQTTRMARVNVVLQHALADALRDDSIFRSEYKCRLTVSGVDVSPDFRVAEVRVQVVNDEHRTKRHKAGEWRNNVIRELAQVAGLLRKYLADRVVMRHTPALRFRLDNSLEMSGRIDELLGLEASPR